MGDSILTEPPYVHRLTQAFRSDLPGCEIDYENVSADRYRFRVVWKEFDEMEHADRQHLVWQISDPLLHGDEIFKVPMIMTLGLEDLPHD